MFLMAQRENMLKKTEIFRSNGLEVKLKNGQKQTLHFEKHEVGKNIDSN